MGVTGGNVLCALHRVHHWQRVKQLAEGRDPMRVPKDGTEEEELGDVYNF